jgi:hypothetical protein
MTTYAGFGRAVITPALPVQLAGFSARTDAATSVADDLEVRAVVVRDARTLLCLVVCDLLGMSPDVAAAVRGAVARRLGVPTAHVLTSCTHTHSGPSVITGADALGWPTPPGYVDTLVTQCVVAADRAQRATEPVTLHHAQAPLPADLSVNRRGLPYEPTFALLDARRGDGTSVGLLANVAIHPVALGPESLAVSADWVASFRSELDPSYGAAVLLPGALGDVNPRLPDVHGHDVTGSAADAHRTGRGVAAAVIGVRPEAAPLADSVGLVATREITVPVEPTPLALLTGAGADATMELVEWALGDARLVSLPGEAFHALGRAVEGARNGPVLLAGLAPAWQGYLPMPYGDGYEESVSLGAAAVDALRAALLAEPSAQ